MHEALGTAAKRWSAAFPVCVPGHGGSGGRTRPSRLMGPGWAVAHPQRVVFHRARLVFLLFFPPGPPRQR